MRLDPRAHNLGGSERPSQRFGWRLGHIGGDPPCERIVNRREGPEVRENRRHVVIGHHSEVALTSWASLHEPAPVARSGVRFGATLRCFSLMMSPTPSLLLTGISNSPFSSGEWQTKHSQTFVRYWPRAMRAVDSSAVAPEPGNVARLHPKPGGLCQLHPVGVQPPSTRSLAVSR